MFVKIMRPIRGYEPGGPGLSYAQFQIIECENVLFWWRMLTEEERNSGPVERPRGAADLWVACDGDNYPVPHSAFVMNGNGKTIDSITIDNPGQLHPLELMERQAA